MKNQLTIEKRLFFLVALLLGCFSQAWASEKLNNKQLQELLVGNFLVVTYSYSGEKVPMWEYYLKDGSIFGSTDKWGGYTAKYEIRGDKVCPTYSSGNEAYNGCYSYKHVSGDQYQLVDMTWPENPSTLKVKIVKGLQSSLKNKGS